MNLINLIKKCIFILAFLPLISLSALAYTQQGAYDRGYNRGVNAATEYDYGGTVYMPGSPVVPGYGAPGYINPMYGNPYYNPSGQINYNENYLPGWHNQRIPGGR